MPKAKSPPIINPVNPAASKKFQSFLSTPAVVNSAVIPVRINPKIPAKE